MKTALLIFTILLALPAVPQDGAGHFSKEGLAFDYPAGWTLADSGDAQLQRLTLTRAGGSNIIIVFAQRELVTTAAQPAGGSSGRACAASRALSSSSSARLPDSVLR